MRRAAFGTVLVMLGLTGCASGGGSGGNTSTGGSRNLIVAAELVDQTGSAYDAVLSLRPRWLQARGGTDLPQTFVDGAHRGDYLALESIAVSAIDSMRYLDPSDATTMFGTGYPYGVIEVRTR